METSKNVTKSRIGLSLDSDVIEKLKNMAHKDARTLSSFINKILSKVANGEKQ